MLKDMQRKNFWRHREESARSKIKYAGAAARRVTEFENHVNIVTTIDVMPPGRLDPDFRTCTTERGAERNRQRYVPIYL